MKLKEAIELYSALRELKNGWERTIKNVQITIGSGNV